MYTSRKVRKAVQELSDEDFAILLDDLDPDARSVVDDDAGRANQALELTRHYDESRSLGTLVALIRDITPHAKF